MVLASNDETADMINLMRFQTTVPGQCSHQRHALYGDAAAGIAERRASLHDALETAWLPLTFHCPRRPEPDP